MTFLFFLKIKNLRKLLNINKNEEIKKAKLPQFIRNFGEILFYQAPESFEFYKGDLPKNWLSFLVVFKNGIRIDFKFIPLKELKNYYEFEPLSKVLIDKDKKFVKVKNDTAFCIKKPTQKDFDEVRNEFYWLYGNLEKALLRKQLILANCLLGSMRKVLFDMLSFKIGLKFTFKIWLGKENTYILKFLKQKEIKIILNSFDNTSLKQIRRSRKNLEKLFFKTNQFVAKKNGFKIYAYRKNIFEYCNILNNL
ncbi:aminoglycoside 6-adenylyltransferase [Campylobacter aviculae]|uniref:aminoglycoside 6-adenylyltransferase n=1 Tax=Campylobacter aviculae TaxID=2510190 RepID=UPI001E5F2573|nr:aminoglycoside 6-adenylyltransferase [Campylobacter aviculae]